MVEQEVPLHGGRVTASVVRIADTVRRTMGPHSAFVHQLLRHLEVCGAAFVPRVLGVDAAGREILSYLEGDVPSDLGNFADVQWSLRRGFCGGYTMPQLRLS